MHIINITIGILKNMNMFILVFRQNDKIINKIEDDYKSSIIYNGFSQKIKNDFI